jgi:hypothetical protein
MSNPVVVSGGQREHPGEVRHLVPGGSGPSCSTRAACGLPRSSAAPTIRWSHQTKDHKPRGNRGILRTASGGCAASVRCVVSPSSTSPFPSPPLLWLCLRAGAGASGLWVRTRTGPGGRAAATPPASGGGFTIRLLVAARPGRLGGLCDRVPHGRADLVGGDVPGGARFAIGGLVAALLSIGGRPRGRRASAARSPPPGRRPAPRRPRPFGRDSSAPVGDSP